MNISACLSAVFATTKNMHKNNEYMERNWQILSRVMNIWKLCGKFNLLIYGHQKNEGPSNKKVFLGLANYVRKINAVFNSHIKETHVFKVISKIVQNKL